jgi:NADH:ubiquinone oxidoreductase subunit 5 (subunit L)/multisubunit Na+/H+ antiporter MnhA subunit
VFNLIIIIGLIVGATILFFLVLKLVISKSVVIVSWELLQLRRINIEVQVVLDVIRIRFVFMVRVITAATVSFSKSYIRSEIFYIRFHLLLLRFVGSIFLLVLRPRIISILLGWDILAVTSFLLVVYYSNRKAFNAGILTALSNRVGDRLILLAIAYIRIAFTLSLLRQSFFYGEVYVTSVILISLAATTKRAQLPFSA